MRRFVCLAAVLLATTAHAQLLESVRPGFPAGGETVGPKPIFKVLVEGKDVHKMRFKIELSRNDFDTIDRTLDQQKDENGWAFLLAGDEWGGAYRTREPLAGGAWSWRAYAWNGVDWVKAKDEGRFVVDAVPPADVEGIDMRIDRRERVVHLRWIPVTTDQEGRPERVAKYKVYRYQKKSFFFSIRAFELGETDRTWFEDRDPQALEAPLVFYKIVAEDEVGNEEGRRY